MKQLPFLVLALLLSLRAWAQFSVPGEETAWAGYNKAQLALNNIN